MPHLMMFGIARLQDMVAKGNVWYVRHYESYFEKVTVVYLAGHYEQELREGGVCLVSVGSRRSTYIDILFAPFRLYRVARDRPADVYLTADQWYSWWNSLLIRILLRAKVVLMPVCIPEQLYRDRGITVSGLPRWLERIFIGLSFWCASYIYTARAFGDYVRWLSHEPMAQAKVIVTPSTVEALPSNDFFRSISALASRPAATRAEFRMVYVGRLHQEKLVDHLVRMMSLVRRPDMRLVLVGDGPERENLEKLAHKLGVAEQVEFQGYVSSSELPRVLAECDVFVSTLTGTSLREAAIMGLPVIAYDRDWIHGLLMHEKHALLVASGDVAALAAAAIRLREDVRLSERLAENIRTLGNELWSPATATASLRELHQRLTGADRRNR